MRAVILTLVLFFLQSPFQIPRSWTEPVEPFRIAGNLYYVGTAELTAFLLVSPRGHILLDAPYAENADRIEANIVKLGYDPREIRWLLNSHAHSDHAGALAHLKRRTGARLAAAKGDVESLLRGGRDDPHFGDTFLFPPVTVDRLLEDGDVVEVGDIRMTALLTPGHTPGCTTWSTTVQEGAVSYNVIFVCSTTAPGYQLVNNPKDPSVVENFRRTFARLRELEPDIFLASHASFFRLLDKMKTAESGGVHAFLDREGYHRFVQRTEEAFEKQLAGQRAAQESCSP